MTIRNIGDEPGAATPFLTGDTENVFSLDGATTVLEPGETYLLTISFDRSADVDRSHTAELVIEGPNQTLTIPVTGDIASPVVAFDSCRYDTGVFVATFSVTGYPERAKYIFNGNFLQQEGPANGRSNVVNGALTTSFYDFQFPVNSAKATVGATDLSGDGFNGTSPSIALVNEDCTTR